MADKNKKRAGRQSVVKGDKFEREIIDKFNEALPPGTVAVWADDIDIVRDNDCAMHGECKDDDSPRLLAAYKQAVRKARPGAVPFAIVETPAGRLAVCNWDFFRDLIICELYRQAGESVREERKDA